MHYTFNCYWRLLPLFSTEKRLNLAQCCHVVVEYFRSMRNNLNFIQNLPSLRRWRNSTPAKIRVWNSLINKILNDFHTILIYSCVCRLFRGNVFFKKSVKCCRKQFSAIWFWLIWNLLKSAQKEKMIGKLCHQVKVYMTDFVFICSIKSPRHWAHGNGAI